MYQVPWSSSQQTSVELPHTVLEAKAEVIERWKGTICQPPKTPQLRGQMGNTWRIIWPHIANIKRNKVLWEFTSGKDEFQFEVSGKALSMKRL